MAPYRETNARVEDPEVVAIKEALDLFVPSTEEILWCGRPRRGLFVRGMGVKLQLAYVAQAVVVLIIASTAMRRSDSVVMMILGAALIALAVFVLVAPFLEDALQRARTFYALTNRRVVVVVTGRLPRARGFELPTATFVLRPSEGVTGTLDVTAPLSLGDARDIPPQLRGIADAAEVLRKIEESRGRLLPLPPL